MPNRNYCTVPMCKQRGSIGPKGEKVTFHSFPKDEKQQQEWLMKINRAVGRDRLTVKITTKICSLHFLPHDFVKNVASGAHHLMPKAVPSVFPWSGVKNPRKLWREYYKTKLKGRVNKLRSRGTTSARKAKPKEARKRKTKQVQQVPAKLVTTSSTTTCSKSPPSIPPRPVPPVPIGSTGTPASNVPRKLIVAKTDCALLDSNMILKVLNLPPNVMYNISATTTNINRSVLEKRVTSKSAVQLIVASNKNSGQVATQNSGKDGVNAVKPCVQAHTGLDVPLAVESLMEASLQEEAPYMHVPQSMCNTVTSENPQSKEGGLSWIKSEPKDDYDDETETVIPDLPCQSQVKMELVKTERMPLNVESCEIIMPEPVSTVFNTKPETPKDIKKELCDSQSVEEQGDPKSETSLFPALRRSTRKRKKKIFI